MSRLFSKNLLVGWRRAIPTETVGDRLAQCRRLLSFVLGEDVSQDSLALMAGLAKGSMSQWEGGYKRPSRDTLERLVAVLHKHGMDYITLAWLDYGEGAGPPKLGAVPPKRKPRPITSKDVADEEPPKRRRG